MSDFDSLEIGELMARYARLAKRIAKLSAELDTIRRFLKENV